MTAKEKKRMSELESLLRRAHRVCLYAYGFGSACVRKDGGFSPGADIAAFARDVAADIRALCGGDPL